MHNQIYCSREGEPDIDVCVCVCVCVRVTGLSRGSHGGYVPRHSRFLSRASRRHAPAGAADLFLLPRPFPHP